MLFKCTHEADSGVGDRCWSCHVNDIPLPKSVKPSAVMGRPKTKTQEEKDAKKKEWQKKNRVTRNHYHKMRARKANNVIKGQFVIELDGQWRRDKFTSSKNRWGTFDQARTYQSIGKINMALKMIGKGIIMIKLPTERATRRNYKENGLTALAWPSDAK